MSTPAPKKSPSSLQIGQSSASRDFTKLGGGFPLCPSRRVELGHDLVLVDAMFSHHFAGTFRESRRRLCKHDLEAYGEYVRLTVVVLGWVMLCVGCSGLPEEVEPNACQSGELRVVADGQELPWVEGPVPADDTTAAGQRTLTLLAQHHHVANSPYVPVGEAVDVVVGSVASAAIQDAPITSDGAVRWKGWQDVPVSSVDTSVRYLVPENWATALSSDLADYEPGSSIRGVVLTISCETGTRQFGFAFRTDPAVRSRA